MSELERRRCPECHAVFDCWLGDDGQPEDDTTALCPVCLEDLEEVVGVRDDRENLLWSTE